MSLESVEIFAEYEAYDVMGYRNSNALQCTKDLIDKYHAILFSCADGSTLDTETKSNRQSITVDLTECLKCRACGIKFYNLGDLEIHLTVEHMQRGDVPS